MDPLHKDLYALQDSLHCIETAMKGVCFIIIQCSVKTCFTVHSYYIHSMFSVYSNSGCAVKHD